MPDAAVPVSPATPVDPLFAAVRAHGGLPSVGHALGKLSRLLESDSEATQELANAILADVSLTQRLLKLANTIIYRTGPQPVTTVTRAIVLLGFNQVRDVVMSLVLLDGVLAGADPAQVRAEFHQALLAGCLARELLAGVDGQEAEEAGIAAMFRNVGRLLVAVYGPEQLAAVRRRAAADQVSESLAAKREIGRSFEEVTEQVLREWSLPERITAAVAALPPRIDAPRTPVERVRVAAQFADAVASSLAEPGAEAALAQALERFAPAFAPDRADLERMVHAAAERTRGFEIACGLSPAESPLARLLEALPQESRLEAEVVAPAAQRDAIGRPLNAQELLLAGLAEVSESLARGADLNAVIRIVLETLHTSLGFARTALGMRDPATGTFRTRASFGEPRAVFAFPGAATGNLFAAALAQGADLHIADVGAEKIRAALPPWFARDFALARSFLLMPVVLNGRAVGFFYADRPTVDPKGLSAEELNVVRSLRNQVVLAMRMR